MKQLNQYELEQVAGGRRYVAWWNWWNFNGAGSSSHW